MADLPSFDDLQRIARDEMLSRNPALTAAVVEEPGSETNLMTASSAGVGDEVVGQVAQLSADLYLDSAKGAKLDRLVFDRYGLVRKQAAPGIGTVQFSLPTPTVGPFSIPAGTLMQAIGGVQFITTASVVFPGLSSGPVAAPVRSTLAGSNQQAAIGTITSIISPVAGAPGGLTVTNTVATAGAADQELDDSLRARARSFFTTARRGTIGAIQAGALAVPGVATATAFEVLDAFGRPAKSVQLVVSDQFTDALVNLSPTPPTYQAQSQALATVVFNGLDDVRAAGIDVDVIVGMVELLGIQLGLRFTAGVDVNAVAEQARAAIVAYVNGLAPGGAFQILAPGGALDVLRTIPGLIVTGAEIVSPPGDVVAQPLQVLRTTFALVLTVAD